jgi:RimJ/RimL family protein N-acetyltransferase
VIETLRLELHLIEAEDLITLFEHPEDFSIYEGKSYKNPHRVLVDDSGPLSWRVPQVKEDASLNMWFVRWIVAKESREIIGSTSFHGVPDASGMIEIGLGIHPDFQNQGYGYEALKAMWSWVIAQPGVKTLRYTVSPENVASIHLVNKFGFTHMGQQIDEIDGPEDIYEMSALAFAQKYA